MSALGQVAVDASAAQDAGRLDAIPGLRQEEVRDSPWAAGRDFPWATAEPERPLSPEPQNERERRLKQLPQDALLKAACRLALLVSQVLVEWCPVAPWQALLASLQADESVLAQALSFPALRASHSAALAHEAAPWVPPEQPPRAPPVQLASPLARRELPPRSVSPLRAPR
jgi:hypothetical protein